MKEGGNTPSLVHTKLIRFLGTHSPASHLSNSHDQTQKVLYVWQNTESRKHIFLCMRDGGEGVCYVAPQNDKMWQLLGRGQKNCRHVFIYKIPGGGFGKDGGIGSTGNLSPLLDNSCTGKSVWCNYSGTPQPTGGLFQGKAPTLNCSRGKAIYRTGEAICKSHIW